MRKIVLALIFLGLMFCNMGNASGQKEVVQLSGTDPIVFSTPGMQKDGVGTTQLGAEIWGTPTGWNDAGDGAAFGNVTPLLTGSLAKAAYMENKEKVELLNTSEQFEAYINKTLNETAGKV